MACVIRKFVFSNIELCYIHYISNIEFVKQKSAISPQTSEIATICLIFDLGYLPRVSKQQIEHQKVYRIEGVEAVLQCLV